MIFLPAILIAACGSSNPAFRMMYPAYKLNKQGDNKQPWCTPFPIWNQSFVPCLVLTVASWPAYRFLRRQVRRSGIPIFEEFTTERILHIWVRNNFANFFPSTQENGTFKTYILVSTALGPASERGRSWCKESLWRWGFITFMINPPLLRIDVITNSRAIEFLQVVILKPLKSRISATGMALRVQSLGGCSDLNSMTWCSIARGALMQLSPACISA